MNASESKTRWETNGLNAVVLGEGCNISNKKESIRGHPFIFLHWTLDRFSIQSVAFERWQRQVYCSSLLPLSRCHSDSLVQFLTLLAVGLQFPILSSLQFDLCFNVQQCEIGLLSLTLSKLSFICLIFRACLSCTLARTFPLPHFVSRGILSSHSSASIFEPCFICHPARALHIIGWMNLASLCPSPPRNGSHLHYEFHLSCLSSRIHCFVWSSVKTLHWLSRRVCVRSQNHSCGTVR